MRRAQHGLSICLVASSRFPVAEPFMGGLEAHTHALAGVLMQRGHRVSLFAAPGSDPALGATSLDVAPYTMSDAARADVGAPPEAWMQEHHAYLDLMLGISRGRHGPFDVVHNNSLHHLPVAMSEVLDVPVVTTLHTPPMQELLEERGFDVTAVEIAGADHGGLVFHDQRSWEELPADDPAGQATVDAIVAAVQNAE